MNAAFIANELKGRLLEHAPNVVLPAKRLDLSRADIQVNGVLPYQEAELDCVIASLILISQEEVAGFFKEIHRILAPKGIFLFSTLGNNTPHELEILGDTLLKAGFQLPVVDREILQLQYDDRTVLLKDLELSDLNEKFVRVTTESPQQIIATFEVMYGYALGAVTQTIASETIEIPIENIKIRRLL